MAEVTDNRADGRYELPTDDGDIAFAAYEDDGDVRVFTHTIVPEQAQGHGVASTLIAGALADVRRQGRRIVPQCRFVQAYLQRHPEERDLVA